MSASSPTTVPRMLHRPPPSWRSRHVFGALRLRPAEAQHSHAEGDLLKRFAVGAATVVELGVAEGGSAAELRSVMAPNGRLYLVDPYEPGKLRMSMPRIIARRTVRRVRNGTVIWIRSRSDEAIHGWGRPIDYLFIDADHSYERASSDWRLWTPFVRVGGQVALHDSVVFPGGWADPDSGPVRLLAEVLSDGADWTLVRQADSLTIVQRVGVATRNGTDRVGTIAPGPRSRNQRGLRVLRVADVPSTPTAGMSGFMLSSGAEMGRRGHDVSFWFRGRLAPTIDRSGIRRLFVPWLIVARVLAAVVRRQRFDIVEIHEPLAGPYGLLAHLFPRRLPACVVLSFGLEERGWQAQLDHLRVYGRRPPLKSRVLVPLTLLSQSRLGLRTAAAVLVPSSADRDYLIHRLQVPAERVSCAFTGVSKALFEVASSAGPEPRVLFLGSWIERKGTHELVAAWSRLAAVRPSARLTIAGTGESGVVAEQTRGLQGAELLPVVTREELPKLLGDHNIFVLPSWFEGLSLAMLEAAAAGLACVVTGICGSLDVFRPGDPLQDGAVLVRPNDVDDLYEALLTVIDDRDLRAALGRRARERARRFAWSETADRSLAAYAAAAKQQASRGARGVDK